MRFPIDGYILTVAVYYLRFREQFSPIQVEIVISPTVFWLQTLAEERPALST